MKTFVYQLVNSKKEILYIGESANPTQRMYFHRGNRKSKVYGVEGLQMEILKEFGTKKEAYEYQCHLQEQLGFVTDRSRMSRPNERHPKTRLTNDQVKQIKKDYVRGNGAELGRKYGVSRMLIGKIVNGRSYKSLED